MEGAGRARGGRGEGTGSGEWLRGWGRCDDGCNPMAHKVGSRLVGGAGGGGRLPAGDVDRGEVRRHQSGLDCVECTEGARVATSRLHAQARRETTQVVGRPTRRAQQVRPRWLFGARGRHVPGTP